ncbi:MAG: hypothetical protein WCT04_01410 [Planctomycetota bacterium]
MKKTYLLKALAIVAVAALSFAIRASEQKDLSVVLNSMAEEIRSLRGELATVKSNQTAPPPQEVLHTVDASVNRSWDNYDSGAGCATCNTGNPVVTRNGKLVIHGLVQVWYQYIQNDSKGWEDGVKVLGASPTTFGANQTRGNDTFRVRRAEIAFDYCLNDNISSRVKLDPAAMALGFPSVPSNQAPFYNAGYMSVTGANGQGQFGQGCVGSGSGGATLCTAGIGNAYNEIVRNGGSDSSRLLQEAYINYHNICFLPNHDIQVGQMKRRLSEEGYRDSGELDFAERAMITQVADDYDLGIQIHGSWFCDRLQYWGGIYDGAGTAFQSRANRPDDNDKKDFLAAIIGRPVWNDECWGSLELGYSGLFGKGGQSAGSDPVVSPNNGLNRKQVAHSNQYAWLYYAPAQALKGLWVRGEWGQYRDQFAPGEVVTGLFNYTNDPRPFSIYGYYGSVGYKFGQSAIANCLPEWAHPMELAYRHEQMENLFYQSLTDTNRSLDVFRTTVDTVGLNYYLKGHQAKLQLNYNFVREQHSHSTGDRQIREVRNDNLVLSFQVMF